MACNTRCVSRKRERQEAAGRWLRDHREQRGYKTIGQFARALGVDQSMISRYERGVSEIDDERAEQIAEVLGMDLIDVRRGLGLWVPPEAEGPGEDDDLPRAEDYVPIVIPLPDGSGDVRYALSRDEIMRMAPEQRRALAREMIDMIIDVERQQPPEADDA